MKTLGKVPEFPLQQSIHDSTGVGDLHFGRLSTGERARWQTMRLTKIATALELDAFVQRAGHQGGSANDL